MLSDSRRRQPDRIVRSSYTRTKLLVICGHTHLGKAELQVGTYMTVIGRARRPIDCQVSVIRSSHSLDMRYTRKNWKQVWPLESLAAREFIVAISQSVKRRKRKTKNGGKGYDQIGKSNVSQKWWKSERWKNVKMKERKGGRGWGRYVHIYARKTGVHTKFHRTPSSIWELKWAISAVIMEGRLQCYLPQS